MTQRTTDRVAERTRIIRELYELVEALDRRVPQVQRSGEASIARTAAVLRAEAMKRIADLEREGAVRTVPIDAGS